MKRRAIPVKPFPTLDRRERLMLQSLCVPSTVSLPPSACPVSPCCWLRPAPRLLRLNRLKVGVLANPAWVDQAFAVSSISSARRLRLHAHRDSGPGTGSAPISRQRGSDAA